MMLARRAPDGPDGSVPARASERTLLAVAAGSVENRQQGLHPSVVVPRRAPADPVSWLGKGLLCHR